MSICLLFPFHYTVDVRPWCAALSPRVGTRVGQKVQAVDIMEDAGERSSAIVTLEVKGSGTRLVFRSQLHHTVVV